jgi:alpha-beta hydrolase superfamily lysophospholipase
MTAATPDVTDPAEPHRGRPEPNRRHGWLILIAAVVVVATLALTLRLVEPAQPGAFYTPPSPIGAGDAGTIVRAEPLETAPAGSRGWRVLYRSTAPDGSPIAVSGTVFAPSAPTAPGSRRVVAWAHPTTGVDRRCAPSTAADGGAATVPGLADLLRAGYVVTATDYPGLGTPGPHPYLVGRSEATAMLDSVRAAGRLDSGAGRTVALWGHSQGGHAALFAGQVAPEYAPELDVVGIAAAAPATELAELLRRDVGGLSGNVLASMALVSWSEVYADRGVTLDAVVEPAAVPLVELIAGRCIESAAQDLIDVPDAEILRMGFLDADPWSIPPWDALLAENTPGATAVDVPVFVAQGTADTVVWPGVTASWIADQCRAGVIVDERLYQGRTHPEIAAASAADVRSWIADRFEGRAPPAACMLPPDTSEA